MPPPNTFCGLGGSNAIKCVPVKLIILLILQKAIQIWNSRSGQVYAHVHSIRPTVSEPEYAGWEGTHFMVLDPPLGL